MCMLIFRLMHNYLSFMLNTGQISTWSRISQLSAHNSGIIGIPSIITHCSPQSIDTDLHPACTLQRSISQTKCSNSTMLGSCIYMCMVKKVTLLCCIYTLNRLGGSLQTLFHHITSFKDASNIHKCLAQRHNYCESIVACMHNYNETSKHVTLTQSWLYNQIPGST